MEEQELNLKNSVIKYSIIIALLGVAITTLIYIFNEELMIKWWVGLISLIINLGLLIYFGITIRNENGGYLKFKNAFFAVFLIVFFATVLSSGYTILLHTVIDPDLKNRLTEQLIEQTTAMLEKFNLPDDQIDEAIDKITEQDNFGLTSLLKNSAIASIISGLLFGLIVGAIVKKKKVDPDLM